VTIKLRAHHMLCLTTYIGMGYSPAFTANYDGIVARLAAGEPVELVEGPDDICAPLTDDPQAHCHKVSVTERDRLALEALQALPGGAIGAGAALTSALMAQLRAAFAGGGVRAACRSCEWAELCDSVAASGFAGALVLPAR
jgi:hypothetical protein